METNVIVPILMISKITIYTTYYTHKYLIMVVILSKVTLLPSLLTSWAPVKGLGCLRLSHCRDERLNDLHCPH